jgi:hypothetical protein
MRVLISTIVRNRARHLLTWAEQLVALRKANPDIEFDLVAFENDSEDGTKQILSSMKPLLSKHLNNVELKVYDLGWPYFSSVKAGDRVEYLAKARNKTLEVADIMNGLASYDKIVCIEPDVTYDAKLMSEVLKSDLDIASGYSMEPPGTGVPDWIYDSWATRVQYTDSEYFGPKVSELPHCLDVASTFNCFCVYKADPFIEGVRFSGTNPLTNNWDCDTTNICFEFAKKGYDKVGMYNIPVVHHK